MIRQLYQMNPLIVRTSTKGHCLCKSPPLQKYSQHIELQLQQFERQAMILKGWGGRRTSLRGQ